MNTFGNAYRAECYKMTRKGRMIKLAIIIVACIAAVAALFALMFAFFGVSQDIIGGMTAQPMDNDEAIAFYTEQIETLKNTPDAPKAAIIEAEKNLEMYTFLKENNLTNTDVQMFGGGSGLDASGFALVGMGVGFFIVCVYAVVKSADNIAGERRRDVLKMTLLRPIGRSKLFTAKFLSVFTVAVCAMLLSVFVSMIAGLALGGIEASLPVLYLNFTGHFALMPAYAAFATQFVLSLFEIFLLIQFVYFITGLARYRMGKALPLCLFFFGGTVEGYLQYVYVGAGGFFVNADLSSAMTFTGGIDGFGMGYPFFMPLWGRLLMALVWLAGMMIFNYYRFRRTDF